MAEELTDTTTNTATSVLKEQRHNQQIPPLVKEN
jgi:hypothetical protein